MGYGLDEDYDDDWEDEDEEYGNQPRPINLHGDRIEALRLLREGRKDKPITRYDVMEPIYRNNALVKVGSIMSCPCCNEQFKKKSYQQKFCNVKCKDHFWNSHPDRIRRTEEWKQ
ncbi:hypothetical protein CkP1_0091 [Citrobacter phage CkP1]|nr:hypothetical protein CkP1_0091 [Citrobacter phage CkP1]